MTWRRLQPGDRVAAVAQVQGLKRGEKIERLAVLRVVSVREERLDAITADDVVREGLDCTPEEFVALFCRLHHCRSTIDVTRIEFAYEENEPCLPI